MWKEKATMLLKTLLETPDGPMDAPPKAPQQVVIHIDQVVIQIEKPDQRPAWADDAGGTVKCGGF